MDSTGFSSLIIGLKRAREQNRLFALTNPKPQIARQFYITGLDRVFTLLTVSEGVNTVIAPYDLGRNTLRIVTSYEDDSVVIYAEGNISIYASSDLPTEIRRILAEDSAKPIRIDLSNCILSDLFYFNTLLIENQNVQKAMGTFADGDHQAMRRRVIELKGIDTMLTGYLASVSNPEPVPHEKR